MIGPQKMKILYEMLCYNIKKEDIKIKPLYAQTSERVQEEIKKMVMELPEDSMLLKRAKKWNEIYNKKQPKEEDIIKYFENETKEEKEGLIKIKKPQTKYIVNVINEKINDVEINNIDDYITIVSRVQQTCNHFNKIIKDDKIVTSKEDKEIKRIQRLIKKRNKKKLSRIFQVNEKEAIQVAEEKIKEIEYNKEVKEYIEKRKRKQKLTKIINQRYLSEEVNIDTLSERINENEEERATSDEEEKPEKEQIINFWMNIIGIEKTINENENINEILNKINNTIEDNEWNELTQEEFKEAIRRTPSWKAPGPDMVSGYMLKKLKITEKLYPIIKDIIAGRKNIEYINAFKGKTALIYKKGDRKDPKNYRPITCLSVITKMITSIVSQRLQRIYMRTGSSILSEKQKGVRKFIEGTKECALETIAGRIEKKTIEAFYDFEKAFDSVSHKYLSELMEKYKFPKQATNIIKNMLEKAEIELTMGQEKIGDIKIKNGLLQGDSLSPFLFVLTLDPLIKIIEQKNIGFEISPEHTTDICYFIDDLRVVANKTKNMEIAHNIIKTYAESIGMKINYSKCAIIQRGLNIPTTMENIPKVKSFTYLGIPINANGADEKAQKEIIFKKVEEKLKNIEKDALGGIKVIQRINSEIMGMLRYSFGIVNYSEATLNKIDKKIMASISKMKLKRVGVTNWRYYLPYKYMGLNLQSTKIEYLISIIKMKKSLIESNGIRHAYKIYDESRQPIKKRLKEQIYKYCEEIKIEVDKIERMLNGQTKIEDTVKEYFYKYCLGKWRELKRSGKLLKSIEGPEYTQKYQEIAWKKIELNKIYMGQVIAMQERATVIGAKLAQITKKEGYKWCRKCLNIEETVDHILTACPKRKQEIIARHDNVGKEIYRALGKKYGLFEDYKDNPVTIRTEQIELIWNQKTLQTPADQSNNQPDITLIDKNKEEIITFDVSIVKKEHLHSAYNTKIQKYEEATRITKEGKGLRYSRTIPIIISVEGIIHKKSAEALEEIGLKIKWHKILYNLLIFNINMIQKSYNENWEHREKRREMQIR